MDQPPSGTVTHALSCGRGQRDAMDLTRALKASAEEGRRIHTRARTHAHICTYTHSSALISDLQTIRFTHLKYIVKSRPIITISVLEYFFHHPKKKSHTQYIPDLS